MRTQNISSERWVSMVALFSALSVMEFPVQALSGQESRAVPPAHAKSSRSSTRGPKTNSASTLQPRLVALPVTKCIDCNTSLRKRIAVMPVKVGTLPREINMGAESVSEKLRDDLEQAISK